MRKKKKKDLLLSHADAKRISELYNDIIERNPEAAKYIAFREEIRKKKK